MDEVTRRALADIVAWLELERADRVSDPWVVVGEVAAELRSGLKEW